MRTERLERKINQLLATVCPSVVLTETPDSEVSTHIIEPSVGGSKTSLAIMSLPWFSDFLQGCSEKFSGIYLLGDAWLDYITDRVNESHAKARAKRPPAPRPFTVNTGHLKEAERLASASVATVAEYHGLIITPCEYCLEIPTEEIEDWHSTTLIDKQTGETIEAHPLHPRRRVTLKPGLPYKELLTELIAEMPLPTSNDETMADHVAKLEVTPVRFNTGVWSETLFNKTPAEIWQWMVDKGLVYDYLIDARKGDGEGEE